MRFRPGRYRKGSRQWRKASAQNRRIGLPNATDDTGHSAASAVTGTFLEQPKKPLVRRCKRRLAFAVVILLGRAIGVVAAQLGDGLSNIKFLGR
jgi:hypothetical protein